MNDKNVWLITVAGRGLGLDIAKSALAAGHAVIATGRDPARVTAAIGHHKDLLTVQLDVTRPADAQATVAAGVAKFRRIDVRPRAVRAAVDYRTGAIRDEPRQEARHPKWQGDRQTGDRRYKDYRDSRSGP
jgi:NAD(P)-dependent dehydrogenase (short-subunit alcohol dehydrogenase family)